MAAKGGPHVQMYRQIVGLAVYILLFTIIGMDQFQVDPAPIFDGFCCLRVATSAPDGEILLCTKGLFESCDETGSGPTFGIFDLDKSDCYGIKERPPDEYAQKETWRRGLDPSEVTNARPCFHLASGLS
jgi:hypothetical protein